ncbi:MAG: hypothetical protein SVZ03_05550 [Spirochaetota bacterium]|nr:hypothetical protein [Spirochaetota bacterium]
MRYYILSIITISLILSGCITMQKPIDDVYLSEMTSDEAAKLEKMEGEIISQKKDKDITEKNLSIGEQKIRVCKASVSQIQSTKILLQEEEKLYTLSDNTEKLNEVQNKIKECMGRETQAKANLKYNMAKRNEIKALLDVKNSELAVKVAKLDYEKAKIAKKYQSKRPEKFGDDIIDDIKYEDFLNDQTEKLNEKQEKHKETIELLNKAEDELKNTGYEVEQ